MGTAGKDLGNGGSGKETGGEFLCGSGASGVPVWVQEICLTPWMENILERFHHQEARQMAGMGPNHKQDRMWVYPPIGVALAILGLEEIGVYISRHHNTVVK